MQLPISRIRELLAPTYTIDRELGRGGMATVCLAQDTKHDRVVALKVLHPGLAESVGPERFLREIKVVARLSHPHILPLFDSGEIEGFLYYVMPYVEGESLRERLERENQLPIDEAIRHTLSIASALDYAHRQNVVHRDIKPENVMMYEGEAMVMDFGIAKTAIDTGEHSITKSGALFGTPAYIAPEQAAGAREVDGRADQYSLAVVLYEMLAGERPFGGVPDVETFAKRFKETPTPVGQLREGVPESVETALTKAMAPDPTQRYASIALFAQVIGSGTHAAPITVHATPRPTVSAAKSVAVLPFANMSAEADNEYFADGIAEEIINALTKVQSLRVASRTSSFAFKGKNEDIGEIGRKLKVSTVLEGSVRKVGTKLRITAQLINVADGYHLWAEQYDREMEDIFAIQADIAQAIVKSLRVILSEGEKLAMGKVRTVNVDAYDYYLRGRKFFHQHRRKSLEYAVQMYEKAIEIDSDYALAYAGIAVACSLLYTYFDSRAVNSVQADVASQKALELVPDLAEAHLARAFALRLGEHAEEAEKEFEAAIKLDPKLFDAFYFYGRSLKYQGRYAESAKMLERASLLRPEDFQAPAFLGGAYAGMGMRAEANAARRRAVKLIEQRLDLNPDDARAYNLGATTLMKLGNTPRAMEFAAMSLSIEPDDPLILYNVACMYALMDKREDALGHLERAVRNGFGHKESMANDPDLDSIRRTPWFHAIAQAMTPS
ncbi:MAG TPA: protein kinase [Gemmatimonadaceae bacterium]|nr:protein kinase [Gemmatimonadaceae bacterium]